MLWRRPVSGGYSEIVVHNGRAFTMELRDGADFVVALDAATGRQQWSVRVGPAYKGHGGSDDGPISTPAASGNDLFALDPHGQRIAVDVATGRERWRHDLVHAFGATTPTWGFAASPLIEGQFASRMTARSSAPGQRLDARRISRSRFRKPVNRARCSSHVKLGTSRSLHDPRDGRSQTSWGATGVPLKIIPKSTEQ